MARPDRPAQDSMLDAIREWLDEVHKAQSNRLPHDHYAPFDGKSITDPLAQRTRWTPLTPGGPTAVLFELASCGRDCLYLRPTPLSYIVSRGLILIGSIWLLFAVPEWLERGGFWATLPEVIFATFFIGAGLWLAWLFQQSPMVFDRVHGLCVRSRPAYLSSRAFAEAWNGNLTEVHAIQVLPEYLQHRHGGIWGYEVNLVLNTGARVGVLHHFYLDWIDRDAKLLAEFLGKPIWDARVQAELRSPD